MFIRYISLVNYLSFCRYIYIFIYTYTQCIHIYIYIYIYIYKLERMHHFSEEWNRPERQSDDRYVQIVYLTIDLLSYLSICDLFTYIPAYVYIYKYNLELMHHFSEEARHPERKSNERYAYKIYLSIYLYCHQSICLYVRIYTILMCI